MVTLISLLLIITVMMHHISSTDYVGSVSSGIDTNTNLVIGDTIYSSNNNTRFKLDINGELILQININSIWTTQWTNNVISGSNAILAIQHDGNLVVYDRPKWDQSGLPVCCTWTAASNNYFPPQSLIINNDGTANMMDAHNYVDWSTSAPTSASCQGTYACTPTMFPSTVSPSKKPTLKPTYWIQNTILSYPMPSFWIQETIQKKNFDVIIGSHDFTFINFDTDWCIHCRRFAPAWSEAENKSNAMIFNDKNEKQAVVKLLHINCMRSLDLCGGIGIRAYPTVRLYKIDGRFAVYHGERKVDSMLDFVKYFVENETVPITSEIETIQKEDFDVTTGSHDFTFVDFDTVLDFGADFDESVNYYYGGILIVCVGIIGIFILYLVCSNKKQTGKEAKEQILVYDSTTIQTNLGEQEGI